ncbi:MAG: choice-of-anchor I family protein [Porticoccaceae bacterium]
MNKTIKQHPLSKAISILTLTTVVALAGCASDGDDGAPGTTGATGATGAAGANAVDTTVSLSFLGRYETDQFDESAAEVVDYDATLERAYVVNAMTGGVDVIDASAPNMPMLEESWDVASDVAEALTGVTTAGLGAANGLSVANGHVAVAIEASPKQNNGYVAFYTTAGVFQSAVEVGALPDMVQFTPDGSKLIVANEGEPNGDYSNDPNGSVSVIDTSGTLADLTASDVSTLSFAALTDEDLDDNVRISAKSSSIAADLEPEYVAISTDSSTAYVTLQENNAVAVIDLSDNSFEIIGLGYKNFAIPGNEMDASNKDDTVNIRSWPVFGTYMPDAIAAYDYNDVTYLITANEGDGREYLADEVDEAACSTAGGFDFDEGDCFHYLDEIRIKDLSAEQLDIPNLTQYAVDADDLLQDEKLGRLKIITNLGVECTDPSDENQLATTGQPDTSCTYTSLHAFGGRSITIWNSQTGLPVYDSGNEFEVITANRLGMNFNASNDDQEGDDRSDDKGPEPEGIAIGEVGGKTYAFVGLERVGGIMVYNVSNPETAEFVQYINTRDFTVSDVESSAVGDLGPEGLKFVSAEQSPIDTAMLIVGNEVSGTTAFFSVEEIAAD